MKTTEFIVENSVIAQEADVMHADHEVQMARSQMYSAAQAAIEIHRLLKNISEMQGIEGWVASKLTLASQYLESVRDHLKYDQVSQKSDMMTFAEDAADYAFDKIINEEFSNKDVDAAVSDFVKAGGEVKKGKPSKGPRRPGLSLASKHIGGGGDKMKPSRTGRGSNPQGKAVVAKEQDSTPSIGGMSRQTGPQGTTTSYSMGPISVSSTARPDQSTVTSAEMDMGPAGTIRRDKGIGFDVTTTTPYQSKNMSETKNKKLKEMATGGASSAGGIATSMSGPAGKPGTGKPKKIANAHKAKKITVGKGIY